MQYLQDSFAVYLGTKEYRDNYDQIDWSSPSDPAGPVVLGPPAESE